MGSGGFATRDFRPREEVVFFPPVVLASAVITNILKNMSFLAHSARGALQIVYDRMMNDWLCSIQTGVKEIN